MGAGQRPLLTGDQAGQGPQNDLESGLVKIDDTGDERRFMEHGVKARQRMVDKREGGRVDTLTENTKEASKTSCSPSSIPTVPSDLLSPFPLSSCILLYAFIYTTFSKQNWITLDTLF